MVPSPAPLSVLTCSRPPHCRFLKSLVVDINSLSFKDEGGGEGGFKRDGDNNFLLLKKKGGSLSERGAYLRKGAL